MTFTLKSRVLIILLALATIVTVGFAQRNVCPICKAIVEFEETICPECSHPMNKCLDCGTENQIKADYCVKCSAPLAEMRLLSSIASDTRKSLKLGQSKRAQLDKELSRLAHLSKTQPEKAETFLFQKAEAFHKMNFFAKEADTWQEYLIKYPETNKRKEIEAHLSEALRKWGYLFYSQKKLASATEKFEAATMVDPDNASAWEWLGAANLKLKNNKKAASAYLNALKADPGNKTYIHFLKKLKHEIPTSLLKKSTNAKETK